MVRSFRNLAIIAGLTAGLAACGTTTTGVATIDPNVIASVQSITASVCAIVPTVDTILSLFKGGAATTVATAESVANTICSAVAPLKATTRFRALPRKADAPNSPVLLGTVTPPGGGAPVQVYGWRR